MTQVSKPRIVYHEYQHFFTKKNLDDDEFDGISGEFDNEDDGLTGTENSSPFGFGGDGDLMGDPFVISPDGAVIPVKEYGPIKSAYNFWLAHTNFDITDAVIDIIDDIEGVETLERFTRYRMRIGIGKLFKPREIFIKVNNKVFEYLNQDAASSLDEPV